MKVCWRYFGLLCKLTCREWWFNLSRVQPVAAAATVPPSVPIAVLSLYLRSRECLGEHVIFVFYTFASEDYYDTGL